MVKAEATRHDRWARVLIVDDSPSGRLLIRHALSQRPGIEVVADLASADEARRFLSTHEVDVITLDVEMPGTNGLDFLREVRRERAAEVIMISAHTKAGSRIALEALAVGAVEVFDRRDLSDADMRSRLSDVVTTAGAASPRDGHGGGSRGAQAAGGVDLRSARSSLILIGASTGGVSAIEALLAGIPAECPPIVIAQHMPANFLASFAERLDGIVAPRVTLVDRPMALRPGRVYLGAGGQDDVVLQRRQASPHVLPEERQPHARWTPSVDALFASAAPWAARVVAAVLTGMGNDGTRGLRRLHDAGARTLAQSGESCVVDGMPRSAREAGVVDEVVPIGQMGAAILRAAARGVQGRIRA